MIIQLPARFWRVLASVLGAFLAGPLAVRSGTVTAWGDNYYGQTDVPVDLTNIVAITGGLRHSLALRSDGTVTAWGDNWAGQATVPSGLTNAVAIAGSWHYSLALRTDGSVAAWGDKQFGATKMPADLTNAVAIAAGGYHNLALRSDGTVVAWGANDLTNVPGGLSNVLTIAAQNIRSLALRSDGTVAAWGHNYFTNVPPGLNDVVAIAVGYYHYLALKSDGTVTAWGDDYYGETRMPAGLTNIVAIAAGFEQSMVLTESGTVIAWGYDEKISQVPALLSNVVAIAMGHGHAIALVGDGSPFVTTQPFDQSIVIGHEGVLHVKAAGVRPMSYQWRRDGVDLPGATNASLRLPAVQSGDGGSYTVVLSNSIGQAESKQAKLLTVEIPPLVQVHPTNQQLFSGGGASFQVTAEGSWPFTYQWRRNGLDLPGATNAELTLPAAQPDDSGMYTVLVSNSAGQTESGPAALKVIASPPLIQVQPTEQHVSYGGNAAFRVVVDGSSPFSYQWFFGDSPLPGATGATLVVTNADPAGVGLYWVRIANQYGATSSAPVMLFLVFNYEFADRDGPLLWDFSGTYAAPLMTLRQDPEGSLVNNSGGYGRVWKNGSVVGLSLGTPQPTGYWIEYSSTHVEYVLQNGCTATLTVDTSNPGQAFLAGDNTCVRVGQEYVLFLFTWAPYRLLTTNRHSSSVFQSLPESRNGHWRLALDVALEGNKLTGRAFITLSSSNVISFDVTGTNSKVTKWVMQLRSSLNFLTVETSGLEMSLESIHGMVAGQSVDYDAPLRTIPLTLITNGQGRVALPQKGRPLVIGRDYTLHAVPSPGNLFSNWAVAGKVLNDPTLRFTMSSNLVIAANFVPNPFLELRGAYTALFYDTNAPALENAGHVSLTLGGKGGFSGRLQQGASRYPFSGQFDLALAAQKIVPRGSTNEVLVRLQLMAGSDEIFGTVSNAAWSSELFGYRAGFSSKNPATNFQGAYNALLPGTDHSENGPLGHSFAQLAVNRSGSVSFKGTLADGSSIAQMTSLAANGQWPLYSSLYSGKGSIFGWLTLLNTATNDVMGPVLWTRPDGVKGSLHPAGFTNEVDTLGSRYVSPAPGSRALDFTNAMIELEGGNLPAPLTSTVILSDANKVTVDGPNPHQLSLALRLSSGSFKGRFMHPATAKASAVRGVLLQKQNLGSGFFLGTNQSGNVLIGSESEFAP